jgi:hypothetical protein
MRERDNYAAVTYSDSDITGLPYAVGLQRRNGEQLTSSEDQEHHSFR